MDKFALPDLKPTTDVAIVHENIRAVAALYYVCQHERMGVFQVVERIAELFHQGLLPLDGSSVTETLHAYTLGEHGFSANERADLYEWTLGEPGGGPEIKPNREFRRLWLVFVAAVVAHARERGPFELVWPASASNAALRKATRDLAVNLSFHGGGMAGEAARLAGQLREALDVLRLPLLQHTFGARDAWELIERVDRMHLGGAVDVARLVRLADAGRRIFDWLTSYAEMGGRPDIHDAELVDAAEAWLAASDAAEAAVEEAPLRIAPPLEPTKAAKPAAAQAAITPSAIASELIEAFGFGSIGGRAMLPSEGVIACFHGAPRTGKTQAAYLLANALRLSVVRIDLVALATATIVAMEKQIAAALYAAEQINGMLLFDDAAPLFGRRTVTAHIYDRYSNLDVPALVRRIEAYPGLVILATSMHLASDGSFAPRGRRRTWRVLHFPRPTARAAGIEAPPRVQRTPAQHSP